MKQRVWSSVTDILLLIITLVKRPYPFDKIERLGTLYCLIGKNEKGNRVLGSFFYEFVNNFRFELIIRHLEQPGGGCNHRKFRLQWYSSDKGFTRGIFDVGRFRSLSVFSLLIH